MAGKIHGAAALREDAADFEVLQRLVELYVHLGLVADAIAACTHGAEALDAVGRGAAAASLRIKVAELGGDWTGGDVV